MSIDEGKADAEARQVFQPRDQHGKGSAMGLIKADAEARALKTARLRALRLAQVAAPAGEAAKTTPAKAGRPPRPKAAKRKRG